MTTKELLEQWMEQEEHEKIKPQTYERYRNLCKLHILPVLGEIPAEQVTRKQITELLNQKRHDGNLRFPGGLSSVSLNLILSVLNMAFSWACDMEWLEHNPCDRVRRFSAIGTRQVDAFTKEEQKRLEKCIDTEGDERLFGIILSFYTGLRIGELLGLEWSDFNEDCTVLTVSKTVYRIRDECGGWKICIDLPKTASSFRVIPLPAHITKRLCELREKKKSIFLICNKKGERMSTRSYQYIFERLTQRAEVRKLNFHALRHTFATRALENGADVKTLSEIMGHTNTSITLNRYAHSMMDTKIAMMNRMTRVF